LKIKQDFQLMGVMAPPIARAVVGAAAHSVKERTRKPNLAGVVVTDFDPFDQAVLADPNPAYAKLHAAGRVHYNPKRRIWIITQLEDVKQAARASDVLISGEGVTRMRVAPPLLVTTDGQRHTEMRRQVLPAFTRAALDSWRVMIDELAVQLVEAVLAEPGTDIVQRLAIPMPMLLIANMLGVPESDMDDFREWSEDSIRVAGVEMTMDGAVNLMSSLKGMREMYHYLRYHIENSDLKGEETLLGRLVAQESEGSLSSQELFYFAFLLLLAGNETTTNLLGSLFQTLAERPDVLEEIRSNPDLIPAAIEEQLRHCSPVQGLYRTAKTDYRVGDAVIPAGSRVLISTGAANRDPLVFVNPDEFRLDRDPNPHVAFGFGAHLCLGAQLTRMEGHAILREVIGRVGRIELLGEPRWSLNTALRGPLEVKANVLPLTEVRL
jgi:cytochrome P450